MRKYKRSYSGNKINVRFYLLFPDLETSGIRVSVSFRGKRIRINIPIAIDTQYWNAKTQRLLHNAPAANLFNNILDKIQTTIIEVIMTPGYNWQAETALNLKDVLLDKVMPESKKPIKPEPKGIEKTFLAHFKEYIIEREATDQTIKKQSIKTIRTTLNHLSQFVDETDYDLTFDSINDNFLQKFTTYLTNKNIQNSTQKRHLKNIKTFMKKKKALHNNSSYQALQIRAKEPEIIVLSIDELEKIKAAELNERLSRIRDVFLCQCYTGLRVSDLKKIREHNIDFRYQTLKVKQVKTGELHYVPLFDETLSILKKYDYWLPTLSDQRYNVAIRELCETAGIDTLVDKTINVGNQTITQTYPKYELITSHVARKTFITIAINAGLPIAKVMTLSGHSNYNSFKRYLALSKRDVAAQAMKELNNFF